MRVCVLRVCMHCAGMCIHVICVYAQRGLLWLDHREYPLGLELLKLLLSCEFEFENGKISLGSLYIFTYMGLYVCVCTYMRYTLICTLKCCMYTLICVYACYMHSGAISYYISRAEWFN